MFASMNYSDKDIKYFITSTIEYLASQYINNRFKDRACPSERSNLQIQYYFSATLLTTTRRLDKLRNKTILIYAAIKAGRHQLAEKLLRYGFVTTPDQIAYGIPLFQNWRITYHYSDDESRIFMFNLLTRHEHLQQFYHYLLDDEWTYKKDIQPFQRHALQNWIEKELVQVVKGYPTSLRDLVKQFGLIQ